MNFKNKSFFLGIFFVLSLLISLYIGNSQKNSFRYFIWNIQEVRIGKIIFISFTSGLVMSTMLSKILINNVKKSPTEEKENIDEEENENNNYFQNKENSNEYYEMPPERDLRDTQPTISVNYRVIKNKSKNLANEINQTSEFPRYQDDWVNDDTEW